MKLFEKSSEEGPTELLQYFLIGVSMSAGMMLAVATCYCCLKNKVKMISEKERCVDGALDDYIKVIKAQDEEKKKINQALLQYRDDLSASNQILKAKIYKNNTKNNNFYAMEAMVIDNPEQNLANLMKNYPILPTLNSPTAQEIEATIQSRIEHHEKVMAAAKDYLGEAYCDLGKISHHTVLKIK